MGRSQETFSKKEVRKKKEKRRKEKEAKRLAKKEQAKSGKLEDMIAYVDEFGNITSEAPDPNRKKKEIKPEQIEISVPRREKEEREDGLSKGVVSFFNVEKGFGFIKNSHTQESAFVHVNNVLEEIKEHDVVLYELEMGPRGPVAKQVKLDK